MGFRFRKRIGIFKFLNMNLSKSGIGFSFGVRGARIGINSRGLYTSVGLPGTGLYYYKNIKLNTQQKNDEISKLAQTGLYFFEKKDYRQAEKYFSDYLKQNPNDYGIIHLYGFSLFKQAKYKEAMDAVSNIPQGNEYYDEALAIKAFCLQDLNDNDNAEKLLNQAMPLLQGLMLKEAYFCMGEICEAKGDYKSASEWYKKYSEIQ
jgi:tetratricopeptide (TPR) repeat protein